MPASLHRCRVSLAIASLIGCAACGDAPKPPNVLLITVDTLRADHLETYGYEFPTSPTLEAFSKKSTTFERAYTQIPKTNPSIASLLTGLYGQNHGLLDLGIRLDDHFETIAEILHDEGYRTCGAVGQYNLTRRFGFDQGFEEFHDRFPDGSDEVLGRFDPSVEKRAEQVSQETIACLENADPRPFFAWAHYMDPHAAYDPPEADSPNFDRSRYPIDELDRERIRDQAFVGGHLDVGFYLRNYDREIRYLDSQIAVLLNWLTRQELESSTVIVFTADHGEYMGEHDLPPDYRAIFRRQVAEPILIPYFHHGATLSESEIRVPLIVKPVGALAAPAAGRRVANVVELIDVVPTILDLVGLSRSSERANEFDGESFADMLGHRDPGPPTGEALLYTHETNAVGLRTPDYKLYLHPHEKVDAFYRDRAPIGSLSSGFLWLFEESGLEAGTDVAFQQRDRVGAMRDRLFEKLAETHRGTGAVRDAEVDRGEDLEAKLKALGYVE